MMPAWLSGVALKGFVEAQAPLARYSTWRAGGAAELLFEPEDRDDLAVFLRATPESLALTWLGLGSNVLVRDGGIMGAVILTGRALSGVEAEGDLFHAGAGVPCAKLARQVALAGRTGAEWLVGIPGSIGGALAMNAGAYGSEFWSEVVRVETMDRHGVIRQRPPGDYQVAYRHVRAPAEEWFVACTLRYPLRADPESVLARGRQLLAERGLSQPTGIASCGSVFRNPPGDHAGRLIEAAGCKGLREGGCHVAEKHANFIVNDGGATATDIERLIRRVQAAVEAHAGITLEPEVRILGCHVKDQTVTSR